MNIYLEKVKQNCISGILFLLPVLILMILIQKVFGYFAKFGGGIAKMLGFDKILGPHAANIFGSLILLIFVYICGYLVRLAFFKRMSDAIDLKLKEVIPGYEKHKNMAKNQLVNEPKIETEIPVLIQFGEYWQPGFMLEKDDKGNAVINIPKSEGVEIYIVPFQKVKILEKTSLASLKTSIKANGKGLLNCK